MSALEWCLVLRSHARRTACSRTAKGLLGPYTIGKPLGADAMGISFGRYATGESSEVPYASVLVMGAYQFHLPGGYFALAGGVRGDMGQNVDVERGPRFPGPTIPLWRRGFRGR